MTDNIEAKEKNYDNRQREEYRISSRVRLAVLQ